MLRFLVMVACLAGLSGCTEAILSTPVHRQIDKGDEALKAGNIREAREHYEKALAMGDQFGTPEAHLKLGLLYMDHLGAPEIAAENFEKFIKSDKGSKANKGRALTRLARLKDSGSQVQFIVWQYFTWGNPVTNWKG